MACNKSLGVPPAPPAANCGQNLCPCIGTVQTAADSATSSALASAESAMLAFKILQNCLSDKTIKPGGGLKYDEGTQPGAGGIYVNVADLALPNGGLAVSGNKLYVDKSKLVNLGGGLTTDANGNLKVDFSSMPASTLKPMVLAMIQTGGGLMVDASGKIYFDPQSMDTSVFEALMKKLRLPIWLTGNTNFYVDKNHAAASDTLDEGRGLSASKPFASVQAACSYIANNFNMGGYTATINVAAGDYTTDNLPLTLGNFTCTTGRIVLQGAGPDQTFLPRIITRSTAQWDLANLCIKPTMEDGIETWSYSWALGTYSTNCIIGNLKNVKFDFSNLVDLNKNFYGIYSNGDIRIKADTSSTPTGISFFTGGKTMAAMIHASGGLILFQADINLLDDVTCSNFAYSSGGGQISIVHSSNNTNPGRLPQVNANGHTVTGQRYKCVTGGTIATGGAGPEFFPGTTEGTVEASTYSWYK